MGFDPRHWSGASESSPPQQRVTSNVEALLEENDNLRREVLRLQRDVERLRQQRWRQSGAAPFTDPSFRGSPNQRAERVTQEQVKRWGDALARQPGWSVLRRDELEGLIELLNRSSFHSQFSLRQRLDRLVSGLGTDLLNALGETPTTTRAALLAAFALYGVRASEWLEEDPRRVVADLCSRQLQQQRRATSTGRRTRSDRRSSDRNQEHGDQDQRSTALSDLGLTSGASQEAIKQAFRRLVKQHHPDVGGSADAFRRVNEAYQRLIE